MQLLEKEQTRFGFGSQDGSFTIKRENPWHKAGTVLENAPSISEAIEAAKLGWTVEKRDIQTVDGIKLPRKAIVRTDNNQPLGIVADRYQPLQNTESFNFFQDYIDTGVATLETAGSLQNGRKVWILAKLNNKDMLVDGQDAVESYILLSNSHEGGTSVRVGFTPIRVICGNSLTAAIVSEQSQLVRIHHSSRVVQTLEEVKLAMDVVNNQFITTQEYYNKLAQNKNINSNDLKKYVRAIISAQSLESIFRDGIVIPDHELTKGQQKLMERVEEVFEMEYARNAWTAYNSFNFYLNHDRGRSLDSNRTQLMFASGKILDQRAYILADRINELRYA